MTKEEAKANQDEIAKRSKLGWWYGTRCKPCCGVYPKLMFEGNTASQDCYYQCEVCGKRTAPAVMPWVAEGLWNKGLFESTQITMF